MNASRKNKNKWLKNNAWIAKWKQFRNVAGCGNFCHSYIDKLLKNLTVKNIENHVFHF